MSLKTKLAVLAAVPVFALIGFAYRSVEKSLDEQRVFRGTSPNVILLGHVSAFICELQKERGLTSIYVQGGIPAERMKTRRVATDDALDQLLTATAENPGSNALWRNSGFSEDELIRIRKQVDGGVRFRDSFVGYTAIIDKAFVALCAIVNAKSTKGTGKRIASIVLLEEAKEYQGRFRGYVSGLIMDGNKLSPEDQRLIQGFHATVANMLNSRSLVLTPEVNQLREALFADNVLSKNEYYMTVAAEKGTLIGIQEDAERFFADMTTVITRINDLVATEKQGIQALTAKLDHSAGVGLRLTIWANCIAVTAVVVLSVLIGWSISRALGTSVAALELACQQTRQLSDQVDNGSRTIADSTNQQAASVEQTSASLEEISAQISIDTENTHRADALMKESRQDVEGSVQSVQKMLGALQQIHDSTSEMSEIIHAIDSIAFQTNLLALNAAVEAARAGDAGKGFAVVASEVRNLSQQTAAAARRTTELIDTAKEKTNNVGVIADEVEVNLGKAYANTEGIGTLITQIRTSADEQASGIIQINEGVSQIDKGIQQNAAESEKAAKYATDLQEMVGRLDDTMRHLKDLI